jgi:hypothetical protein
MARKQVLQKLVGQADQIEHHFYDGLTEVEREQKGSVNDWAPKDVVAHIAYWKRFRVPDIQRSLDGEAVAAIDDFDARNAEIFEQFKAKSWNEVLAYAEEATAVLVAQLAKMSEKDLETVWHNERPLWWAMVTQAYSHPLVHLAEYYQKKGDMQRAAELTGMLGEPLAVLDDSPRWTGTVHYNVACSYALLGQTDEAVEELGRALALVPQLVEWSKEDPDLDSLRNEAGYKRLYEPKE